MRRRYLSGLIVVLVVTAALYALGMGDYFLFDDGPAISANQAIAGLPSGTAAAWRDLLLSSGSGPTGRPLTMATFGLSTLGSAELSAVPFKLTNVLIHLACGVVLFGFLRQLQGLEADGASRMGSWAVVVAVAVWLLAPLHVSTVLYPVQRMAQLATLFVFLGLYLYARWRRRWMSCGASAAELCAAALWLGLVMLAAVLSKENGLLLLWLLPLVEVIFLRGRFAGHTLPWLQRLALLALVGPLLLLLWLGLAAPDAIQGGYEARDFTLGERLLTQLRVLWLYVGWFVLPLPNHLGFLHDDIVLSTGWFAPWTTLLAGVGWLLAIFAALFTARSQPWLLFGLLFFLIGHSVESSILALEMVFEHRNYLPTVGLSVMVAMGLSALAQKQSLIAPRIVWLGYFLPLLLMLGLRNYTWGDELRMAQTNARHHPDSPRAQYLLATVYERRHKVALRQDSAVDITLLVQGRGALRRMSVLAPESLVPPLALYLFDARWFPGNPEQGAVLQTVLQRATKPVLSASEVNGLNALLDGLSLRCGPDTLVAVELVNTLLTVQPQTLDWHLARYALAHCDEAGLEPAPILESMESSFPRSVPVLYLRLAASVAANDVAAIYAAVANIQALDDDRRQLSRLRTLVSD